MSAELYAKDPRTANFPFSDALFVSSSILKIKIFDSSWLDTGLFHLLLGEMDFKRRTRHVKSSLPSGMAWSSGWRPNDAKSFCS